jgi:hypothetical protein
VCDVVHAVWAERIEADVRAAQQAALMASMFGGEPEWPSLDGRLAEFETYLAAEPERVNTEEMALRDALGLRRPGG